MFCACARAQLQFVRGKDVRCWFCRFFPAEAGELCIEYWLRGEDERLSERGVGKQTGRTLPPVAVRATERLQLALTVRAGQVRLYVG